MCDICYDEGIISQCCGEAVEPVGNTYQCHGCMKFCRIDNCEKCDFLGELQIGDNVNIFVCTWTSYNIRKYMPFKVKDVDDSRYETVKLIKIINDYEMIVKHPNMKKNIKITFDDVVI